MERMERAMKVIESDVPKIKTTLEESFSELLGVLQPEMNITISG